MRQLKYKNALAWKRLTAWLLVGVMLILSGCSGSPAKDTGTAALGKGDTVSASGEEKSMGRYLEHQVEVPEEITENTDYPSAIIQTLEDGSLALLEQSTGLYVSADKGKTWEHRETPWLTQLSEDYISDMALAPDGAAAAIYSRLEETGEDEQGEDGVYSGELQNIYQPKYFYVDAAGTEYEIPYTDTDEFLYRLAFGRDSRLYGCSIDGTIYEFNPAEGTADELFEAEGLADYICFTEKYMVVIASRGVTVYDLEENETVPDEVLQDFITDSTNGEIGTNTDAHVAVAAAGEQEDVIYLALNSGIYRHVLGGTAMEQVADSSSNSLSDPQMLLQGMEVLPDNEFMILYSKAQLCHYVYDADIPTVPEEQLSIYSLEEDYTIRQAVSLFQKKNPEIYIRYEIGMTGANGMTAEDAIKNLNTKIMSGSGPDLIVLDGLPEESYKQKGILADLTGLEAELTGENSLFPNLVDAFREDGKLYSLPVRFRVPLIVGPEELLAGITDLSSLADAAEQLRSEHPKGAVTGIITEEQTIYTLGLSSMKAWMKEDGSLDEEALTEFLTQAKRIYQAESAGYDKSELEEIKDRRNTLWEETAGLTEENYSASASSYALDIGTGSSLMGIGTVRGMDGDFNMVSTLAEQGKLTYKLYQGQTPDSFVPDTRVGISAGSMENELAAEFFRFLFGPELQDLELPGGFPMNQASFEKMKENPRGDDSMAGISIAGGDDEGSFFSLDIKWVTKERFEELKNIIQSLKNPCVSDSVIEQTVSEIGAKAVGGSMSVEDAVAEIVKKAAIYLSE